MPYRVTHHEGAALASVHLSGTVGWPDIEAAIHAVFGHPDWVPGAATIWDARDVATLDVAPADLLYARVTMAEVAPAREGGRTAIVTRNDIHAGTLGVLARLGPPAGRRVSVFYRLEDALGFLGRVALPEAASTEAASTEAALTGEVATSEGGR